MAIKYRVLFEKGNYSLILRGEKMQEYAVVNGLNKGTGEWDWTCGYWNFGKCYHLSESKALLLALDCFLTKTEKDYISRYRMEEFATKFKDIILEMDDDEGMERIMEETEPTDYESEWLELTCPEEDV